jgi:DNA-binding SARP family transcriptional activator
MTRSDDAEFGSVLGLLLHPEISQWVTVYISVLGPLRVETGDRVLGPRDFGGATPRRLLELLALEGRVASDRLADLLFGERLPRDPGATLTTYVSVLQHRLGSAGSAISGDAAGAGFRLDAEVDVHRFDRLTDDGRHVEALTLVRGQLLADEPTADWAVAARARHHGRRLAAWLAASAEALSAGAPMQALARAEAAQAWDPACETACRLAMSAARALGRPADEAGAYRRWAATTGGAASMEGHTIDLREPRSALFVD